MKNIAYLHPYVYTDITDMGAILYNTLDGNIKTYKKGKVYDLINKLNKNNYVWELDEKEMSDECLIEFLNEIRRDFFGNSDKVNIPPIQLKPNPRMLGNNENNLDFLGISESGENLLDYLHIVNIHISFLSQVGSQFKDSYKQINFPQLGECEDILELSTIKTILDQLNHINVYYRLIIGDLHSEEYLNDLIDLIGQYKKEATFIIYDETIKKNYDLLIQILNNKNLELELWSQYQNYEIYRFLINSNAQLDKITINAIVSNNSHINELENLTTDLSELNIAPYPLYINNNLSFFESNVFFEYEDIVNQKTSLFDIQRKSLLNPLIFGNIHILSNGDTYSNLNCSKLGNVTDDSLGDLVIYELKKNKSWFINRFKVSPCKDCIYRLLCPPITNYELYLNKYDFCKNNFF
jgi:pseudo-rSAM protein